MNATSGMYHCYGINYIVDYIDGMDNGVETSRSELTEQGVDELRMCSFYKYRYKQARPLDEMRDNCSICNGSRKCYVQGLNPSTHRRTR